MPKRLLIKNSRTLAYIVCAFQVNALTSSKSLMPTSCTSTVADIFTATSRIGLVSDLDTQNSFFISWIDDLRTENNLLLDRADGTSIVYAIERIHSLGNGCLVKNNDTRPKQSQTVCLQWMNTCLHVCTYYLSGFTNVST